MRRGRRRIWLVLLAALSLALVAASLLLGAESISFAQAWRDWRTGYGPADSPALAILLYQRAPRTLAALFAGAGLALVGAAFQALLRNPLATPYTLGVASSAALGAWTAFIVADLGYIGVSLLGLPTVQLAAFLFAGLDVVLVYVVAAGRGRASPSVLLLAGVTMGMLANSGILLTRYLARPDRLVMMDRWLMGGVDVLGYQPVVVLAVGVVPCAALLLLQANRFDQLAFGEELAAGRGINVTRLQLLTFIVGSLLTAIVVSVVGPIGFIGLIVPHSVRMITGSRHRLLLPLSLICGGGFLCACDILARMLLPGETPIGIVTTIIGAPFFLHLLMRREFTDWR